jgi:hypothetical protein
MMGPSLGSAANGCFVSWQTGPNSRLGPAIIGAGRLWRVAKLAEHQRAYHRHLIEPGQSNSIVTHGLALPCLRHRVT